MNSINSPTLVPFPIANCRLVPPFARRCHHYNQHCHLTRTGTTTAIAIDVVDVIILICVAATTNTILPAADARRRSLGALPLLLRWGPRWWCSCWQ